MEAAMAFGKRLVPPSGDNGFVAPPPDNRLREITYPWIGKPEQLACNMALGNFANNVKRRLVVDGRLHAEALAPSPVSARNAPSAKHWSRRDGRNRGAIFTS
jgi:hypothetical protein